MELPGNLENIKTLGEIYNLTVEYLKDNPMLKNQQVARGTNQSNKIMRMTMNRKKKIRKGYNRSGFMLITKFSGTSRAKSI